MAKAALKIEEQAIDMQPGVVTELPLDLIDFDPDQPRKDIDQAYIEELAADIRTNGVLQPITVRRNTSAPGRWFIVYGECRTRGSRLACKPTIPALLAPEADDLTRLLNQVKENHIRRALNPIELALVLRRMRDEHKLKSNARIEDALKAHGITNLSGSYISNLIRLVDLPEWARQAIRAGALTAAHGKYLLQAAGSDAVMDDLRAAIDAGEEFSVRTLQRRIVDRFGRHHTRLDPPWWMPFDYKTECVASGCQKMRKISGDETSDGGTFCMDAQCFAGKKAAALASTENDAEGSDETHTMPTIADDGSVNLDAEENEHVSWSYLRHAKFDITACADCEHRHDVVGGADRASLGDGCFEPGGHCYASNNRKAQEALDRQGAVEDDLLDWLREEIAERAQDDINIQAAVITCIALGIDDLDWSTEEAQRQARHACGIHTMRQLLAAAPITGMCDAIPPLLDVMNAEHIMPLAHELGIGLNQVAGIIALNHNKQDIRRAWNELAERAEREQGAAEESALQEKLEETDA